MDDLTPGDVYLLLEGLRLMIDGCNADLKSTKTSRDVKIAAEQLKKRALGVQQKLTRRD